MSQVVDRVRNDVVQAIKNDELVLPTLPEVALKAREVADNPSANLDDLGKVIGNDAAMSARIIRVANSPLLRANRTIDDLKTTLMRLGMEYACNLVTGLAMQQMFQATSDLVDSRLRDVWARSSEVAGICNVLCSHYTKLRPDQATLAGLVHKIGVLPVLTYAENHPSLLVDSLTLDRVIDELQGPLGSLILETWDFPPEIRKVPSQHLDFTRKTDNADYADLVTVALLYSHMADGSSLGELDYHSVTAFERLSMDPDMHSAEAEELNEDMVAARELFR